MPQIVKIKVERTTIKSFPFDLIYLVPFALRQYIPRIFPASLCFPLHGKLRDYVEALPLGRTELLRHGDRPEPLEQRFDTQSIDLDTILLVVPVLAVKHGPKGPWVPRYLTAPQHMKSAVVQNEGEERREQTSNKFSDIFDETVVLFTPQGPHRPVCGACPRHLLHMHGECDLGGKHCYDSLILRGRSPDEQLQDDGGESDTAPSGTSGEPALPA